MLGIGELPVWQDFGFGLLLMGLVIAGAEQLARYIEAEKMIRRRARPSGKYRSDCGSRPALQEPRRRLTT